MKKIFFVILVSFSFSNCFSQSTDTTLTDTCKVNIPNTITPNSDGMNDMWCITSNCPPNFKDVELWVFDRWGNIIWQTKDIHDCWDCTKKDGKNKTVVEDGVYVWKLTFLKPINGKDEKKSYVGHVTVIS